MESLAAVLADAERWHVGSSLASRMSNDMRLPLALVAALIVNWPLLTYSSTKMPAGR